MTQMRIGDITVGERRREDMGDIAGLAASIDKHGLIHPIVVDPSGRLIAGGRRLAACRSLGMAWVEVRQWDDLTDAELRELELEENLRRKDLTTYEASRELIRRAKTVAPLISTDSVEKAPQGRKSTYGVPKSDVAQAIGVSTTALVGAEAYVAAVEAYPELEALPQVTAIKAAKELDAVPVESREEVRERMKQEQAAGDRMLSIVADVVPGARERMEAAAMRSAFSRGVEQMGNLTMLRTAAVAAALDQQGVEQARQCITRTRRWLDDLESELGSGIRLVASESD